MTGSAARNRVLFVSIAVLSLAGMIVSAVSLQRHYAKSATEFCDFSQKFSCDIVNRSEYSSVEGIPVAGIGVAGYAALFLFVHRVEVASRDAESPVGSGGCRVSVCTLPYLCRSLRADDMVHSVPDFAGADFAHQPAGHRSESERRDAVTRDSVVF